MGPYPPLHPASPSPLDPPSTYLLVHQFRLHLARQPGDTQSPGGRVGVSGSPNCREQKLALCGMLWAFGGHHRRQISSRAHRIPWVSLPEIMGATGTVPDTPKGGSWLLVSRDFEILQGPMPLFLPLTLWWSPCHPLSPTLPLISAYTDAPILALPMSFPFSEL